jgi:glycosyltransferase involved in cell wall biosynthesis
VKKVYLDVAGRVHSLYKELILHPPSGYRFVTNYPSWDKISSAATRMERLYVFQERVLGKIIPVNLSKAYLEKFKKSPERTDLTYATGHVVFRDEPWVVDMEFVIQLTGYDVAHFRRYKRFIGKVLASKNCKRIICWTESAKKSVLYNMDCEDFAHKIDVVRLAVPKKTFIKKYDCKEKIKLLFVGSANILGEFEFKGGQEVLKAFMILRKKYSNIELVVRSDVPQEIKSMYKGIDNIKLLEDVLPWSEVEREFRSADVFLFPSHSTPGLAILDAMSYELPVITTDVWANPEMVENGKTGFVIKKSERVPYYVENFIPNWSYNPSTKFMRAIKNVDPEVVNELVEKTSILIEDEKLRRRMGRAGRQEIETGKFSLEKRNNQLKRIFDEATS